MQTNLCQVSANTSSLPSGLNATVVFSLGEDSVAFGPPYPTFEVDPTFFPFRSPAKSEGIGGSADRLIDRPSPQALCICAEPLVCDAAGGRGPRAPDIAGRPSRNEARFGSGRPSDVPSQQVNMEHKLLGFKSRFLSPGSFR